MRNLIAAALAAGVFVKFLAWPDLYRSALSTGMITAVVFVLVGAGAAFSWVISFAKIPQALLNDTLGLTPQSGYWTIMLSTCAAYFIGCMFVWIPSWSF